MNIALINPEYNTHSGVGHGGIATYTYNIANALSKKGHSVFLFIRNDSTPDYLHDSIKVIKFERASLPFIKKIVSRLFNIDRWDEEYSYGLYKKVSEVHDSVNFDIVDIPEYNGLAAAFNTNDSFTLILNFRTPRILVDKYNNISAKSIDKRVYQLEKRAIKNTDNYRTSSEALKNEIINLYNIPVSKIRVIRNPMNICDCPSINSKDPNKIKLLFTGRLETRKGLQLIKDSYIDVLNISENIEFHFVGEYNNDIKEELNNKRIFLHGELNHNDLIKHYCSSDIFIFPSIFDNSPNSLLEAMSASLPVVASNAPGVNEIIKDNENGLLFETNNKDAFIEKIKTLINNKELREKLAAKALADIKERFSPERICIETIEYYKYAINRTGI